MENQNNTPIPFKQHLSVAAAMEVDMTDDRNYEEFYNVDAKTSTKRSLVSHELFINHDGNIYLKETSKTKYKRNEADPDATEEWYIIGKGGKIENWWQKNSKEQEKPIYEFGNGILGTPHQKHEGYFVRVHPDGYEVIANTNAQAKKWIDKLAELGFESHPRWTKLWKDKTPAVAKLRKSLDLKPFTLPNVIKVPKSKRKPYYNLSENPKLNADILSQEVFLGKMEMTVFKKWHSYEEVYIAPEDFVWTTATSAGTTGSESPWMSGEYISWGSYYLRYKKGHVLPALLTLEVDEAEVEEEVEEVITLEAVEEHIEAIFEDEKGLRVEEKQTHTTIITQTKPKGKLLFTWSTLRPNGKAYSSGSTITINTLDATSLVSMLAREYSILKEQPYQIIDKIGLSDMPDLKRAIIERAKFLYKYESEKELIEIVQADIIESAEIPAYNSDAGRQMRAIALSENVRQFITSTNEYEEEGIAHLLAIRKSYLAEYPEYPLIDFEAFSQKETEIYEAGLDELYKNIAHLEKVVLANNPKTPFQNTLSKEVQLQISQHQAKTGIQLTDEVFKQAFELVKNALRGTFAEQNGDKSVVELVLSYAEIAKDKGDDFLEVIQAEYGAKTGIQPHNPNLADQNYAILSQSLDVNDFFRYKIAFYDSKSASSYLEIKTATLRTPNKKSVLTMLAHLYHNQGLVDRAVYVVDQIGLAAEMNLAKEIQTTAKGIFGKSRLDISKLKIEIIQESPANDLPDYNSDEGRRMRAVALSQNAQEYLDITMKEFKNSDNRYAHRDARQAFLDEYPIIDVNALTTEGKGIYEAEKDIYEKGKALMEKYLAIAKTWHQNEIPQALVPTTHFYKIDDYLTDEYLIKSLTAILPFITTGEVLQGEKETELYLQLTGPYNKRRLDIDGVDYHDKFRKYFGSVGTKYTERPKLSEDDNWEDIKSYFSILQNKPALASGIIETKQSWQLDFEAYYKTIPEKDILAARERVPFATVSTHYEKRIAVENLYKRKHEELVTNALTEGKDVGVENIQTYNLYPEGDPIYIESDSLIMKGFDNGGYAYQFKPIGQVTAVRYNFLNEEYEYHYKAYDHITASPFFDQFSPASWFRIALKDDVQQAIDEQQNIPNEVLIQFGFGEIELKEEMILSVTPTPKPLDQIAQSRIEAEEVKEEAAAAIQPRTNQGPISSDDPTAIDQLEEKVKRLDVLQKHMKLWNKVYKAYRKEVNQLTIKNPNISVSEAIAATEAIWKKYPQLSERDIKTIASKPESSYSWEKGRFYKKYELTNNNASIRSTRLRIKDLEAKKSIQNSETEYPQYGLMVEVSTDENRLRFHFDDKPDADTRQFLKTRAGLNWSPNNVAWQRKLTQSYEYHIKDVLEYLEKNWETAEAVPATPKITLSAVAEEKLAEEASKAKAGIPFRLEDAPIPEPIEAPAIKEAKPAVALSISKKEAIEIAIIGMTASIPFLSPEKQGAIKITIAGMEAALKFLPDA